jgi:hypothetical protein
MAVLRTTGVMENFRAGQFGYKKDDIVVLTDDARDPRQVPTRANIVCTSFVCCFPNLFLS